MYRLKRNSLVLDSESLGIPLNHLEGNVALTVNQIVKYQSLQLLVFSVVPKQTKISFFFSYFESVWCASWHLRTKQKRNRDKNETRICKKTKKNPMSILLTMSQQMLKEKLVNFYRIPITQYCANKRKKTQWNVVQCLDVS